jgi:hypothetical protein
MFIFVISATSVTAQINNDPVAEQVFSKKYIDQRHARFPDEIKVFDNIIRYGNGTIVLSGTDEILKTIFTTGLVYPELIRGVRFDFISIIVTREVVLEKNVPTRRYFYFWIETSGFANPSAYYFELENKNADTTTDLKTFIKGARLSYIAFGTVVI